MQKLEVIAALLLEGYSNLTQWSRQHGYEPRTVRQVLSRYTDGNNKPRLRKPRGLVTRKILYQLGKEIGQEIVPGLGR